MQCDAAQLVCGKLSCVRHVGFNSEDARKCWNFPKGEMTGTVGHLTRRTINKRRLYLSLQELTCLLLQASAQLISHLYFHIFDSVYNLRRNMHGHAHNMLHIVRTGGKPCADVAGPCAVVHTYIFISHLYHLIVL